MLHETRMANELSPIWRHRGNGITPPLFINPSTR